MRGVNSWHGIGNLGADPDVRYSAAGSAVTSFRIAINEQWKDRDGNQQGRTEWVRVKCFGRLAEIAGEYLRKGSAVYVRGALRTSEYEKNGEKRFSTEIVADEIRMLGVRELTSDDDKPSGGASPQAADDFDDDIPF